MSIANQLLASFERIAASDGGTLTLLAENDETIRMGYRSGGEADCDNGVCMLPHAEIEAMMRDWMARKAPSVRLEVVPLD
jgi:hypothetical protein